MNIVPKEVLDALGPTLTEKSSSIKDCYSITPAKPHVKLYGLTFFSFKSVLFVYLGFFALAGLIFILEFISKVVKKKP